MGSSDCASVFCTSFPESVHEQLYSVVKMLREVSQFGRTAMRSPLKTIFLLTVTFGERSSDLEQHAGVNPCIYASIQLSNDKCDREVGDVSPINASSRFWRNVKSIREHIFFLWKVVPRKAQLFQE